ncbi:MAG: hypothetical protein FWE49_06835 [Synergistaceae bacterium]|nr:hypothetical protein [Synergistaceae bacterium]
MKKHGLDREEYRNLWMARLVDLEESGLTHRAWCEKNGIPYSTLKYWTLKVNKEKKRRGAADSEKWLALEVGAPQETYSGTSASGKVSVTYGGFRVDVCDGADPDQIFNILRMIKGL